MHLLKYETHAHTSEISKCSNISARELVRFYKNLGHSGVCITDHFLSGNTTVPKDMSWSNRINAFCEGYELAFDEGEKIGIDVFFGWEHSFKGCDFVTFGLDKKWLLNHPELLEYNINDYCDLVNKYGGFLIHAHPFREASYIETIRLVPRKVDAIEILNTARTDFENERAKDYAENYNLLKIAGSDIHTINMKKIAGITLSTQAKDIFDIIDAIKSEKAYIFEDNLLQNNE